MADVESLAERAAQEIAGIPWSSLRARGILHPEYDPTYINDYLVPATDAATRVIEQYQLLPTSIEIREMEIEEVRAWRTAVKAVDDKADAVEGAIAAGQHELSAWDALKMPTSALRMNVFTAYRTALYSVTLHQGVSLHTGILAGIKRGTIHPLEASALIREQADTAYRTLKAIVALERYKVLALLPRKGSVAGLGVVQVPIMLAIVAAVAIVVLAGMLYWMSRAADLNEKALDQVDALCREAQARGDTKVIKECIAKMSDPNRGISSALAKAAGSLSKWLVIGGLVVIGVYFAPLIARKALQTRQALKKGRSA